MKKTLLKHYLPLLLLVIITISCSKEKQIIPDKGTFSISETNITVADNESITLTTGDAWQASFVSGSSASDWVTMDKTSGEAGVIKINFTKKTDNSSSEERSVLVKFISGGTTLYATVSQRPLKSNLASRGRIEVPEAGGDFIIKVKNYDKCKITIPEEYTWLSQSTTKATESNGFSAISFSAGKGTGRTGQIIIENGAVTDIVQIFQKKKKKNILLPDTLSITKNTTSIDVYLRANKEYSTSITDEEKWLNEATTQSFRNDSKALSMRENTTDKYKKALLIVKDITTGKSDTLNLYQAFYNTLPFLSETLPGIYNYDNANGKVTYNRFKDQYSSKISTKTRSFRVQSIKNKNYFTLNSIPVKLDMADYFETRLIQNYVSQIGRNIPFKANVVQTKSGTVWLFDSESGIGIIIKK